MEKCLIYIHGKGGSPAEAEHYAPLFPEHEIIGLDYRATTPWEAGRELRSAIETLCGRFGERILAANSIGAFFAMHAGIDALVRRAYFISPIVDMEALIRGMMASAGVTERELKARGESPIAFGETLSWEYLRYVRSHPIRWSAPTRILYGSACKRCCTGIQGCFNISVWPSGISTFLNLRLQPFRKNCFSNVRSGAFCKL